MGTATTAAEASATERLERSDGKGARKRAPRSAQGRWTPGPDRRDPLQILSEQDADRVPDLVPVRYGRMLASAFTFYRGAAAIMAADLASQPDSGLRAQLCGDAHLSNFGVFEAPDRRMVFDINDFDETLPGPFEWDLKRLAASFEIGGRDRGFRRRERQGCVLAAARAYRQAMRRFAAGGELDVWYARLDIEDVAAGLRSTVPTKDRRRYERNIARARNKDSLRAISKLTEKRDGELRIADRPPVLVPVEKLAGDLSAAEISQQMERLLGRYRETLDDQIQMLVGRYRYLDAGHKVVGVGSVGTRAWIALLVGRRLGDPLFLQIKQARQSVLEPFAGASRYKRHGHRVVAGQRLMQATGDIFLGWLEAEGLDGVKRDFYVRQLWDGKGSAEIDVMSPAAMTQYAGICGWSLARAHARSGDRIAIAAYLGGRESFDHAIAAFAEAYANQNEADYERLLEAESRGTLSVQRGV